MSTFLAKNKKAIIIGSVLLVVAGVAVWYFKFRKPPAPEKTQAQKIADAANLGIGVVANAKEKLGGK